MYQYFSDFLNRPVPQWLREGKFGIYTHWGIYSVPAAGPNVSWYPRCMYVEGSVQNLFHKAHYGDPKNFGYKDFIPMFTAEKFDPDQWAEIFKASGARFAGPVAEHHDGFAMWDTKYSDWNSAKMGPKRDVVAELATAYRSQGLKFMAAMHHAENWFFFPRGEGLDTNSGEGIYGRNHDNMYDTNGGDFHLMQKPDKQFLEVWLGKTKEIIDRFSPDLLWFDFGLQYVQQQVKEEMIAYYYNHADSLGQDVVLTYKYQDLPAGAGMIDIELGRYGELSLHPWLTDTTIDKGQGWGYMRDAAYKTGRDLIYYLIDNVSKNGYLLLNIGPKPNGELPQEAVDALKEIGQWLEVNGDAIYGTAPWYVYGEGDAKFTKPGFNNLGMGEGADPEYTQKDIRYTMKGDSMYAIVLAEPKGEILLTKTKNLFYPGEVQSVELLGYGPCAYQVTGEGLKIAVPEKNKIRHAAAFRIRQKNPIW